jgi:hypothetical protein
VPPGQPQPPSAFGTMPSRHTIGGDTTGGGSSPSGSVWGGPKGPALDGGPFDAIFGGGSIVGGRPGAGAQLPGSVAQYWHISAATAKGPVPSTCWSALEQAFLGDAVVCLVPTAQRLMSGMDVVLSWPSHSSINLLIPALTSAPAAQKSAVCSPTHQRNGAAQASAARFNSLSTS